MAGRRLSTARAAEAPLDAYLSDLASRLCGPRRRREQILDEMRDAARRRHHRSQEGRAARRSRRHGSDAQFGTPQAVADAFAGGLATAYARRTITWYVATGPL